MKNKNYDSFYQNNGFIQMNFNLTTFNCSELVTFFLEVCTVSQTLLGFAEAITVLLKYFDFSYKHLSGSYERYISSFSLNCNVLAVTLCPKYSHENPVKMFTSSGSE